MAKDKWTGIVQWLCAFCGISGITVTGILKWFFPALPYVLIIGNFITTIITAIVGVVSAKKYQKQLSKKEEALSEKDERIKELNEQVEVLRNILITETPAQAGYYMANKSVYDNFKTDLEILKCNLDVSLVKDSEDGEDYHLRFKWKLMVFNPTNKSAEKAKFIYSGDKDDISSPNVTFKDMAARVTVKLAENAVGDDIFIEIDFPGVLKPKSTAEVCIDYTLSKYKFNPDYDFIWLVPDALGFASMSEFCIRFFGDGEVIKNTTSGVLRSYKLSGKYPKEDDQIIPFKRLGEGKEGFEYNNQDGYEKLRGHGFFLILKNRGGDLPHFLQDIPSQNN